MTTTTQAGELLLVVMTVPHHPDAAADAPLPCGVANSSEDKSKMLF